VYDIPFNSRNKYAITITKPVGLAHESPEKRTLLMKGAPEVIVARCTHFLRRGEIVPIDDRFKKEFTSAYESFGSRGQRVLGFAMLDLDAATYGSKFDGEYSQQPDMIPTEGLVFVGLMSLVDPPKASVPQAVLDCHSAGIKVIMVTGSVERKCARTHRHTAARTLAHHLLRLHRCSLCRRRSVLPSLRCSPVAQ
jgi:magnesium-transporting ATPase (P-type)